MKDPRAQKILDDVYNSNDNNFSLLTEEDKKLIDIIVENIDSLKAVATALITSLVKKVLDPSQDVRYHKINFGNPEFDKKGYSARSFDTENITPWMKVHFKRWAMKESAWLTRSIEQPHPFTLDFPGHIKDMNVKNAFLRILDKLENYDKDKQKDLAYEYLKYMISRMKEKYNQQMTKVSYNIIGGKKRQLTIQRIIDALDKYFKSKFEQKEGEAYIPVIAIYSLLQTVMPYIERYKDKKLGELKPHTASDKTSFSLGDIEIFNQDNTRFEVFEIKHKIKITKNMINDIKLKIQNSRERNLERYYILTTADPDIDPSDYEEIKKICSDFLKENGIEIIPNSVIITIKYFLRLTKNPENFIENFTYNLIRSFKEDKTLKEDHLLKWKEILKELGFQITNQYAESR
ncbi:MAG: hypothetical protein RXR07_11455 [Sulfolobaceae archaeon]